MCWRPHRPPFADNPFLIEKAGVRGGCQIQLPANNQPQWLVWSVFSLGRRAWKRLGIRCTLDPPFVLLRRHAMSVSSSKYSVLVNYFIWAICLRRAVRVT